MTMLFIILFSAGITIADEFIPLQNDSLNYTHVLFHWPQISSDITYTITIKNLNNNNQWSTKTSQNTYILEEFLDWGFSYEWQICYKSIYGDNCFEQQYFSINQLPDYFPNQIDLIYIDEDKYSQGINLIALNDIYSTIAVDKNGEPVWFFDLENFEDNSFYAFELLPNGNIVGNSEIPSPSGYGYEINLDGDVVFKTDAYGHHHEFIKSSKNTYFGMRNDAIYEQNHCDDPINEYVYWEGDNFIEYNLDGNIIWEWSTLDYLNHSDFNPLFCDGTNPNVIDWTHANSVIFDQNTNSVYLSLRNISRIINVDYDSGDINWQIGQEEFMNDTSNLSIDFTFSGQHSLRLLENGHILLFDNHSYLDPENSKCLEFSFDTDENEFSLEWEYVLPDNIFSHVRGECERMENGNTLISTGNDGQLLEVTNSMNVVWDLELKNDGELLNIIRNERIPSLYPLEFNVFFNHYKNSQLFSVFNNIELTISNLGWISDWFFIEIYDYNKLIILDSIFVEKNSSNIDEIFIGDNNDDVESYSIYVYPSLAPENVNNYTVEVINHDIPNDAIKIYSIFPNPFNNEVKIQYSLPKSSDLTIEVYNILGQKIDTLFNGFKRLGIYTIKWKANNHPSGIYFVKLATNEYSQSKKLMFIK
jgi:hypothetical protein